VSTKYIGSLLLYPFEHDYDYPLVEKKVDAIVILSGGYNGKRDNLPLSSSAFKRAMYGIMIAKKRDLPIIFSGAGKREYTESDAMRTTVKQLNKSLDLNLNETSTIEKNNFSISYEDNSLDTFENAALTKALFKQSDINNPKIYLVTSAFHMRRSEKLYKYFGFDVTTAATDFKTAHHHSINSYLPSMGGLMMTYYALHEYAGIVLLSFKLK
jgi:uncharacterized SAM-binding protein YcdF (DUF218 family)